MTYKIYCSMHPRYKGSKVPEGTCVACQHVYNAAKTGTQILKLADGSKFVVKAWEEES